MSLLPLPITPADALTHVLEPTSALLPDVPWADTAACMLLATAQQESGLATRVQDGGGPARGLWQFERSGVRGVLGHPRSSRLARRLCASRGCPANEYSVWASLAGDDLLACGFARLLLWTDPAPMPALGDADGAWAYYRRLWRPGHPRQEHWAANYALALDAARQEDVT